MRFLLDTNILIHREDHQPISDEIASLMQLLQKSKSQFLIHPMAEVDLSRDKNLERRKILQSKLSAYTKLEHPPELTAENKYYSIIKQPTKINDQIDDHILNCVYCNAVDFLVTNDIGIYQKAKRLEIEDRVLNVDDCSRFLETLYKSISIQSSASLIEEEALHNIDINDVFFDDLKNDYPQFTQWFNEKSREGRTAWIFRADCSIGAFLMLKEESEDLYKFEKSLHKKARLKICTLKVSFTGHKIGEIFLKIAFEYAMKKNIDEVYLTHYIKKDDALIPLISQFGFNDAGEFNGENIFIKKTKPDTDTKNPIEVSKIFYPSFYSGLKVKKYIIPIQDFYHRRLFQDYPRSQPELFHNIFSESNAIDKAYLCHSKIKKISPGDILVFYLSGEEKVVTSLGIVHNVLKDERDYDKIVRLIAKRTVYSGDEILEMTQKGVLAIIFRWHFHLKKPITYSELLSMEILNGPPQSLVEITHYKFLELIKTGGIPDGFNVN